MLCLEEYSCKSPSVPVGNLMEEIKLLYMEEPCFSLEFNKNA